MRFQAEEAVTATAPVEAVYAVLADADRYREWLPGVEATEILAREGDIVILGLHTRPTDTRSQEWSVEVVHSPPRSLHFSQVDLYAGLGITGRIRLTREGDETRIHGRVEQRLPFFAWRRRGRLRRLLQGGLEALVDRLESLSRATAAAGAEGEGAALEPRKILEVVRRPDGSIRVWYRGEVLP